MEEESTGMVNKYRNNRIYETYEKANDSFEFLGPSPIDYDTHKAYGECVWEEL